MSVAPLKTLRDVPRDQRQPMSKEDSKAFLTATMAQMRGEKPLSAADLRSMIETKDAPFSVKVMAARLTLADDACRFAPMTVLFLTSLCNSPAKVVLWAHYLVRRTYELDGGIVDNGVLAIDFPMGFPTDEGVSAIWDAQKLVATLASNALDTPDPWKRGASVAA